MLAVAGHPPPLIVRGDGSVQTMTAHGTMLGASEGHRRLTALTRAPRPAGSQARSLAARGLPSRRPQRRSHRLPRLRRLPRGCPLWVSRYRRRGPSSPCTSRGPRHEPFLPHHVSLHDLARRATSRRSCASPATATARVARARPRYEGLVWSVARSHRLSQRGRRRRRPEHVAEARPAPRRPQEPGRGRRMARDDRAPRVPAVDRRLRAPGPVRRRHARAAPVDEGGRRRAAARRARHAPVAAVSRLRPEDQALVRMLASDPPASYAEISAALDMPIGSIGPTRARCLERLRARLRGAGPQRRLSADAQLQRVPGVQLGRGVDRARRASGSRSAGGSRSCARCRSRRCCRSAGRCARGRPRAAATCACRCEYQ